MLHQRHLRHKILVVRFHVADHREVPPGVRHVHVDDLSVLGGRLRDRNETYETRRIRRGSQTVWAMGKREFRLASFRVFPRNPPESILNLGEIRDGRVIDKREKKRVGTTITVDPKPIYCNGRTSQK